MVRNDPRHFDTVEFFDQVSLSVVLDTAVGVLQAEVKQIQDLPMRVADSRGAEPGSNSCLRYYS